MAIEKPQVPQPPFQREGLVIKFDTPVTYTPPTPAPVTYEQVEVQRITDDAVSKTVTAFVNQGARSYVLWRGAEYDAIGQWTDTDVANRLKQLLAGQ